LLGVPGSELCFWSKKLEVSGSEGEVSSSEGGVLGSEGEISGKKVEGLRSTLETLRLERKRSPNTLGIPG
jgi:hypothetical protein